MSLGTIQTPDMDRNEAVRFFQNFMTQEFLNLKGNNPFFYNWLEKIFLGKAIYLSRIPVAQGNEDFLLSLAMLLTLRKVLTVMRVSADHDSPYWTAHNQIMWSLGDSLVEKYGGDCIHHTTNLYIVARSLS